MKGQTGEHFQSPIVDGMPWEVNGPVPGDKLWPVWKLNGVIMKLFESLARYQPQALGVLRIMTALQFIEHGSQKLFNFPVSAQPHALTGLTTTAGILEFAGGILLALGLFTRPVAFLLAGEMAIAYFMAHMPRDFFPVNNGGDLAISFCFIFLYLVFAGAGAFALDNRRRA
jgi:putative oxidoreductase